MSDILGVAAKELGRFPITLHGEELVSYESNTTAYQDGTPVQFFQHACCEGIFRIKPVTKELSAIYCDGCFLRLYVPIGCKTFEELRAYFDNKLAVDAVHNLLGF